MRSTSLFLCIVACGGATTKPPEVAANETTSEAPVAKAAPAVSETPSAKKEEPPAPKSLPTSCANASEEVCTPDADFASRVCSSSYPDAALVLFAKTSPFTRLYLRGDVDGWNADGGMSTRAKLVFDEEVLVLKRRQPKTTGMVINGGGAGYLVMRWDGTCVTLEDGEITKRHPPAAKSSPIMWKYLAPQTRDALLANPRVLAAYNRRGKECKGASSGDVSKACELADAALSQTIVSEIRSGFTLPLPERLP